MTSLRIATADLKDSWSAWAAVSLTFIITSGAVALSALMVHTATAAPGLAQEQRDLLSINGGINVGFCSLVGLAVIATSTGLVISSRRGAIARLLLAGAAPNHIVRILLWQLATVTLLCSLVGNAVATLAQPWMLNLIAQDRGMAEVPALTSPGVLLLSSAYCAGIALVAGAREAIRATRIPPVEALRVASGAAHAPTQGWVIALRWVGLAAVVGIIAVALTVLRVGSDSFGNNAFSVVAQTSMMTFPLFGVGLTLVSASVMAPITRVWTQLLPLPGPTWHLARHTVVARADRLVKSVVPAMFAVGLLFGMMILGDSVNATLLANGAGFQLDGTSLSGWVTSIGLPLSIAFAGSVSNLVMMTRQRDAEVALDGVIGATPRQQLLLPALEATIVTGTATIFGTAMAIVSTATLAYGMKQVLPVSTISISWSTLFLVVAVSWIVTLMATVLPGLPAMRQPAPRVIARLIAS